MSQPPPIVVQPMRVMPVEPARPGVIGGMGVASIVIGSISIIACLVAVMYAMIMLMMARMPTPVFSPPMPAATVERLPDVEAGPEGFDSPELREAIVVALDEHQELTNERRAQLNLLLAQHGRRIFPDVEHLRAGQATAAARGAVSNADRLYRPDGLGPQVFDLPSGRIEVSDKQATFTPPDANASRVEMDTSGMSWTDFQQPAGAPPRADEMTVEVHGAGTDGSTTATTTVAWTPGKNISGGSAVVIATLSNLLAAVFLLIAGILTVRNSPRGAKAHWIYVAVKIPLALAAAWAWAAFVSNFAATMSGGGSSGAGIGVAIVIGIVGCIYPLVLIALLLRRDVREYYA